MNTDEMRRVVTLTCGHTIRLRFMPSRNTRFPCTAQQNCGYRLKWTKVRYGEKTIINEGKK